MNKLIILLMLFAINSYATPRKYDNCPRLNIVDPPNSQGYVMGADCNSVYVLPPAVGSIGISNYASALVESDCESEMLGIRLLNEQIEAVSKSNKDLEKANRELHRNNTKIGKLRKSCDSLKKQDIRLTAMRDNMQIQADEKNIRIEHLVNKKKSCKSEHQYCEGLEYEIEELRELVNELKEHLSELDLKVKLGQSNLSRCHKSAESEIAILQMDDKKYNEEKQKLYLAQENFNKVRRSLLDTLINQPGGQLSLQLLSNHNALVKEYRNLNSNQNVNFKEMPIQSAVLNFNRINDGNKARVPLVLRANVHGIEVADKINGVDGSETQGDGVDAVISSQLKASVDGQIVFGEALGGEIIINKYAACSMVNKHSRDILSKIAGTISPTITFHYGVQVDRTLRLKYEESHLYELIKNSSTKRGLFKSSSSSSITEKSTADKWIQVEVISEDERHSYDNSEKIAMDVRREYLDAALMKVARGYLSTQQVNLIDPGSDGATMAGKELQKCPQMYCQYAAVVLNVASGLFGGRTSANANMKQTVTAKEAQEIKETKMVSEFGTQTLNVVVD